MTRELSSIEKIVLDDMWKWHQKHGLQEFGSFGAICTRDAAEQLVAIGLAEQLHGDIREFRITAKGIALWVELFTNRAGEV